MTTIYRGTSYTPQEIEQMERTQKTRPMLMRRDATSPKPSFTICGGPMAEQLPVDSMAQSREQLQPTSVNNDLSPSPAHGLNGAPSFPPSLSPSPLRTARVERHPPVSMNSILSASQRDSFASNGNNPSDSATLLQEASATQDTYPPSQNLPISYGTSLSPYPSETMPPEIRRLSGQFNAPTHVEIERHEMYKGGTTRRRSKKGLSKVKNWALAGRS